MTNNVASYFALFDAGGFPKAFYCREVHGENIPSGTVEISADEWGDFQNNIGLRRWDGSKVVEYAPPTPEPELIVTVLPAVTLWERLTEAEAEQVNAAMATQPFRTRQIFLTANTFRSDHELWPLLVQMATDLFGETRAAELLAAA